MLSSLPMYTGHRHQPPQQHWHPQWLQQQQTGQPLSLQQHPEHPRQPQQRQLGQPVPLQQNPEYPHQQQLGNPLSLQQHSEHSRQPPQRQLGQPLSLQQHPGHPCQPRQQQQLGQALQQHPGHPHHPHQQQLRQPQPFQQQQLGHPHRQQQQQSEYPGQRHQQQLGQPCNQQQHQFGYAGQQQLSGHPRDQLQQQHLGQPINPPPNGYTPPATRMAQILATAPRTIINHLQLPPLSTPALARQSPSLHNPNSHPQQLVCPAQTRQKLLYPGQPYNQHPGDGGQPQQSLYPGRAHQQQHSEYSGQQGYVSMNPPNECTPPRSGTMPTMGVVCDLSPPLSRPAFYPGSGSEASMPKPGPQPPLSIRPPVTSPFGRPYVVADTTPVETLQATGKTSQLGSGGEACMAQQFPSPSLSIWSPVTSPIVRPFFVADIMPAEKSQMNVEKSHPGSGVEAGMALPLPPSPPTSPPLLPPPPSPPYRPPVTSPIARPLGFTDFTTVNKPQTTVFVGQIAPSVGNDFICSLLELCGSIKSWECAQDPSDISSNRFGLCEFESAEGVLRALRLLSKYNIDGEELLLNVDQPTRAYLECYVAQKKEELRKQSETAVKEAKPGNVVKNKSGKPAEQEEPKKDDNETENEENDRLNFGLVTDDDRNGDHQALEKLAKLIEKHVQEFDDQRRDKERNRDNREKVKELFGLERELRLCSGIRESEAQKGERLYQKRLEEWEGRDRDKEYAWMYDRAEEKKRRPNRRQLIADQEDESDDSYRNKRRKYEIKEERRCHRSEKEEGLTEIIIDSEIMEAVVRDESEQERQEEEQLLRQREKEEGVTVKIKEDGEITEDEKTDKEEQGGQEEEQELRQREKEEGLAVKIKYECEITKAEERDNEEQESQDEEQGMWQIENGEGLKDNIKKDAEITEAEKRDKGEQENPEKGQDLEPSSIPVVNECMTPMLSETDSGPDEMEVDQFDLAGPASECQAGIDVLENGETDEPTTISDIAYDSASNLKVNGNTVAKNRGDGITGSGKQTTESSEFHKEGDENAQNDQMRPLVSNATHEKDEQVPAGATESKDGKYSHDSSSVREHEPDDDRSRAPRILDVKQLIDMIPKTKDELVSYEINWAIYDEYHLYERMRPWISKRITEFLGEEETGFVEYIADRFREHIDAEKMMGLLQHVVDEEAEIFVLQMWRMLIFEIKQVETILELRSGA